MFERYLAEIRNFYDPFGQVDEVKFNEDGDIVVIFNFVYPYFSKNSIPRNYKKQYIKLYFRN